LILLIGHLVNQLVGDGQLVGPQVLVLNVFIACWLVCQPVGRSVDQLAGQVGLFFSPQEVLC